LRGDSSVVEIKLSIRSAAKDISVIWLRKLEERKRAQDGGHDCRELFMRIILPRIVCF
jgi:hypothetical protein